MLAKIFLVPISIRLVGSIIQSQSLGAPLEFECNFNTPDIEFVLPIDLKTPNKLWGITWQFLEEIENGLSYGNIGPILLIHKTPATFRILTKQEQLEFIFNQRVHQVKDIIKRNKLY